MMIRLIVLIIVILAIVNEIGVIMDEVLKQDKAKKELEMYTFNTCLSFFIKLVFIFGLIIIMGSIIMLEILFRLSIILLFCCNCSGLYFFFLIVAFIVF